MTGPPVKDILSGTLEKGVAISDLSKGLDKRGRNRPMSTVHHLGQCTRCKSKQPSVQTAPTSVSQSSASNMKSAKLLESPCNWVMLQHGAGRAGSVTGWGRKCHRVGQEVSQDGAGSVTGWDRKCHRVGQEVRSGTETRPCKTGDPTSSSPPPLSATSP